MSSPNFLIYDASAGSGKTFTLTKEYLKILFASKSNDAYKKILAITFTNKAVSEMKHRIVSSLMEFSKDAPTDQSIDLLHAIIKEQKIEQEGLNIKPEELILDASELEVAQNALKIKSKAIIKNIIHNYASFDISTIDKFTHRLIRTFALDLDLPVTFEISLDQQTIVKEAVDRIIAKAGVDDLLTGFLIDFALGKVSDNSSWDFTRELLAISKLIGNENHDEPLDEIKDITLSDFIQIKSEIKENKELIKENISNLATNLLSFITNQPYGLAAFSRQTIPNHINKIIKGDFKELFEYKERNRIETRILKKALPDVEPDIDYIFNQFQEIMTWVGRYLLFENIYKNISPLSLLNSIANEIKLIQHEQNILSISEFNKIINSQIQNQPAPYIYERLGDRYKHFFIDEFQDTSEKQWKNVIPLIDNALSGVDEEGKTGSLMLVGDAKQSIYSWRGGKAEQFIDLSKGEEYYNPFSNPNRKIEQLETNHRSYSQIIEFNNDFFKFMSSKFNNDDYKKLYLEKSAQKINKKIGGFVSINFIEDVKSINAEKSEDEEDIEKATLYLEKTIDIIKQCKEQGFNYADIALLTRKKDNGVLLANHLIENGIPIISSETLLLSNSDDVNFIISVLHVLNNFNDAEAKFNALYYIKINCIPVVETHDFISVGLKQKTEIDLEYYIQQNTSLNFSFVNNKKQDLYQVCENIISVFLAHKSNIAYIQYFLDVVIEQEAKQLGLDDFLSYWDNKKDNLSIPSPENVDAVQIMTVHKSKGLEFPVIIYPFVNDSIIRTKGDTMWINLPTTQKFPLSKSLIDKTSAVVNYNAEIADLYEFTNEKIILDTINVLYVALTRAREQLYVISEKKYTKDGTLSIDKNSITSYFIEYLSSLGENVVDQDTFNFGTPQKVSKIEPITNDNYTIEPVNNANLKSSAIKITQKDALMWGSKRGESIEFGNLIHELLSQIENVADVNYVTDQALRKGKLKYNDYDLVKYILNSVVIHPDLCDHFNKSAKVFNERNIINSKYNNIKPDRVTVLNNQVTLLDYKTGVKHDSHIQQVLDYENALTDMGYDVIKKTLVYIGIEIEEIVNL